MRETDFIDHNKEKWQEFEQVLDGKNPNPKKLSDLFVQITDDLSYSRTFYPNRSVRVYLNTVAQRVFSLIYKNRKSQRSRLLTFWTDELPRLMYESRQAFRLSFFVFALSMAIGVLSCAMEPGFANLIMGDRYIEMTNEFIASGDPMAVYKQRGAFGMFFDITINNIFVAFRTFVMGVFFMVGSMVVLIFNGIMVGAFQYFFVERGLFWDSFLTIWIHGTFEISAIVIAGAAGITMGEGLVFPGTYTRMQAFQQSARRGIKIMVGIVPIFVMAGFFEGYLTRHTETPDLIRGLFIAVCLLIILGYFVWYPWYKSKVGFKTPVRPVRLPPNRKTDVSFTRIKSTADIFGETFTIFKKYFKPITLLAFFSSVLYCLIVFTLANQLPDSLFTFPGNPFLGFTAIRQFFGGGIGLFKPLVGIMGFSLLSWKVIQVLETERKQKKIAINRLQFLLDYLKAFIGTAALFVAFLLTRQFALITLLFTLPFFMIWSQVMIVEKMGPIAAIGRTWSLLRSAFGKSLVLFIILFLLSFLFFTISDSSLTWSFVSLLEWIIYVDQNIMDQITVVVSTFLHLFVLMLLFTIMYNGFGLLYYSLVEISDAPALQQAITKIGQQRKLRGLEKE